MIPNYSSWFALLLLFPGENNIAQSFRTVDCLYGVCRSKWSPSLLKQNRLVSKRRAVLTNSKNKDDLVIPNNIGVGTMAWGDEKLNFCASDKDAENWQFSPLDLKHVYKTCLDGGIELFDTSSDYGKGSIMDSEYFIQKFISDPTLSTKKPLIISTFFPKFSLSTIGSQGIINSFKKSLLKLGLDKIDLFQIDLGSSSSRWYLGGKKSLMNGLAQLVDEGYIQNVGLCNVENERYLESLYDEFDEEYQIKIKTNTIKFSLLNYHNEHISSSFSFQSNSNHKLLSTCKRLNIKLFSSAPLSSGLINGKYSKISPTGGKFIKQKKLSAFSFRNYDSYRGWKFGMDDLVAATPTILALRSVAHRVTEIRNQFTTPAQVAINWVRAKEVCPLVGINRKEHAKELVDCLGWDLSDENIQELEKASQLKAVFDEDAVRISPFRV